MQRGGFVHKPLVADFKGAVDDHAGTAGGKEGGRL